MKVIEIFENTQLTTAKEFKDSFDENEWASILCQLVSMSTEKIGIGGGLIKDNPGYATQLKSRLEKEIGPGIPDNYSTSAWNGRALRRNIRVPSQSWQSFHNHLKQYVGKPCNIEFGPAPENDGAALNIQQANQATPETVNDIMAAAPNIPEQIASDAIALDFLRQAYTFIRQAPQRTERDAGGSTFHDWVNANSQRVAAPEDGQPDQRKVLKNRFLEIVPESGYPITKNALAIRFLAWLRMADQFIATSRERYEND